MTFANRLRQFEVFKLKIEQIVENNFISVRQKIIWCFFMFCTFYEYWKLISWKCNRNIIILTYFKKISREKKTEFSNFQFIFSIFQLFLAFFSFFSFFWSFFDRFSYLSYLNHWKIVATLYMHHTLFRRCSEMMFICFFIKSF